MDELTNQSVSGSGDQAAGNGPVIGTPTGGGGFVWARGHTVALIVLCLAALLDSIDVTVVNVAMPAIKESLHFSESGLAWMVDAYMVPFGGFLLLGGRTGDIVGRRRVLVAGTVLFTIASLGSSLAPSAPVMIVTRALEGLAAAFVVPMTFAIIGSVFPAGPARNRAFGVWGGVTAGAATLGLVLGGVLVSEAGWRWIFLINLPLGIFVIGAALRVLPADAGGLGQRGLGRQGPEGFGLGGVSLAGFDLGGAVSVTAGACLLAYAVAQTESHAWGSGSTIGLLCGAAALLGYFVFHEWRVAAEPLLPLSLLRNRSVTAANVVSVLVSSSSFAVFYAMTLYMQQVLGFSALRTGLAYVPFGLSILVAAGLAPGLVRLTGVRVTTTVGLLVAAAGLWLLTRIPSDGQLLSDVILPLVVIGAGAGIAIVTTSFVAMSGVTAERHGVASALLNASRQLGGALGLAVIATVVSDATARSAVAGHAQPDALTAGFHAGFAVSAGLLVAGVLAAVTLLREEGRGERVNLLELQAGS